ncbi:MAG: redoxin domain-containing protein [Desulforhopalus sp.]|jgi:peroxiredoxin|nr:redoxin domain-containing protein [Desulforhopalus sp.]
MVLTPSTMQELGIKAPDFTLPNPAGVHYSLSDWSIIKGLLVIFMCNHCPYVIHIRQKLVEKIQEYQGQGITVVAINSNDFNVYPDDNPVNMALDSKTHGYTFPYLVDEQQQVAKVYGAACTPDFFLFDAEQKLVYRGQFDSARPGNNEPVTGADLSSAIEQLVAGKPVFMEQRPSMGCNIKWKPGNEPDYFGSK